MRSRHQWVASLLLLLPHGLAAQVSSRPAALVGRWVQEFEGYEKAWVLYPGGTSTYEVTSTTPRSVSRLWDLPPDSVTPDGRWVWLLGHWSVRGDTVDVGQKLGSSCPCRFALRGEQLLLWPDGSEDADPSTVLDRSVAGKPRPPVRPYWTQQGSDHVGELHVWALQSDSAPGVP